MPSEPTIDPTPESCGPAPPDSDAVDSVQHPPDPLPEEDREDGLNDASDELAVKQGVEKPPIYKFRIRFRKDGSVRLLSHHDLLRTFERMLRRASLPFRTTQGFNRRPRLVFALSLPLGVIGQAEVVELELTAPLTPEEVQQRLSSQTPAGLAILEVRTIPPRLTAQVRALCYAVRVPAERIPSLRARLVDVLAAPTVQVERTRPPRRFLDIRPFLRDLRLEECGEKGEALLQMELRLLPSGTARPEEVLTAVGLADLAPEGQASAVLERSWLELEDELSPSTPAEQS